MKVTIKKPQTFEAAPVLSAGVLRVLVACEESQAVTKELRKLGHEAFSCDLLPESGGHPEWHLQQDVTELLKLKWDMIIAFPPCTYLTNAGMCNLARKGATDEYRANRLRLRDEAMEFAKMIYNNDCPLIVKTYTTTTDANATPIKDYPGAIIFTTSDNQYRVS